MPPSPFSIAVPVAVRAARRLAALPRVPSCAAWIFLADGSGSRPFTAAAPGGPDLARYALVCAAGIAGVGFLGWLARRLFARSLRERAARRSLQVLDQLPLASKQRLAVVRCYDRTFLLGIGEREISLVSELDPVVSAPAPTPLSVEERSFADVILRARPRLRATDSAPHAAPDGARSAAQPAPSGAQIGATMQHPEPRLTLDPRGILG